MGLEEDLTPTPLSSVRGSRSELSDMESPEGPAATQEQSKSQGGGGVTGFIRSMIGGTSADQQKHPHTTPEGDSKVTHEGDLHDGTTATVATSGDAGAVPTSLDQATPAPYGVATTEIKEPVSQYAPALESIAGPAEAADPSRKYGPALDSIAGDSAPAAGRGAGDVVGAVTAAAGTAVQSLKQAAGYGSTSGTTDAQASTGSSGAVTPADLPKAGVVKPHEDGTSEIVPSQGQGMLSSAAGTVSSGAQYVKDTVSGLVGGLPALTGTGGTATNAGATEADAGALATEEPKPTTGTGGVMYEKGTGAADSSMPPVEYEVGSSDNAGSSAGVNGPPTVQADEGAATKLNTKPPVSAFATEPSPNGKEGAKVTEIKEDPAATASTDTKPTAAEPKKDAAVPEKTEEKAKSPACGCCVIS